MTQSDAARRVRQVDGRMLFAVLAGLSIALVVEAPARALEFTADLITHANGKTHVSNLYYRDDRWRMEHQDIGPVNVTIVRKDKRSEEHTSELQSPCNLVCRLLLEK